jgi:hypothetical protein
MSSESHAGSGPSWPPAPAVLLTTYLERLRAAQAANLGIAPLKGEVMPYEAGPAQPADPRSAWEEALGALHLWGIQEGCRELPPPPNWPELVSEQEPLAAPALAAGNFPQLVRDLPSLLRAARLSDLRPRGGRPLGSAALSAWAESQAAAGAGPRLLAVGCLRLARCLDQAAQLCQRYDAAVPPEQRPAWDNERAALAWHRGEALQAQRLWEKITSPSAVILFNRGLAALFTDHPQEARPWLQQAAGQLPPQSGWHHLAQLYLSLTEVRKT